MDFTKVLAFALLRPLFCFIQKPIAVAEVYIIDWDTLRSRFGIFVSKGRIMDINKKKVTFLDGRGRVIRTEGGWAIRGNAKPEPEATGLAEFGNYMRSHRAGAYSASQNAKPHK